MTEKLETPRERTLPEMGQINLSSRLREGKYTSLDKFLHLLPDVNDSRMLLRCESNAYSGRVRIFVALTLMPTLTIDGGLRPMHEIEVNVLAVQFLQ